MTLIRRLLFIPLAAIGAVVARLAWTAVFSLQTYSPHRLFYSAVMLTPVLLGRAVPVALFVVLGTIIAPRPGKATVALLGVLGGLCGWPWPLDATWSAAPFFYVVESLGTGLGVGTGLLIGFAIARKRRAVKPPAAATSGETAGA